MTDPHAELEVWRAYSEECEPQPWWPHDGIREIMEACEALHGQVADTFSVVSGTDMARMSDGAVNSLCAQYECAARIELEKHQACIMTWFLLSEPGPVYVICRQPKGGNEPEYFYAETGEWEPMDEECPTEYPTLAHAFTAAMREVVK